MRGSVRQNPAWWSWSEGPAQGVGQRRGNTHVCVGECVFFFNSIDHGVITMREVYKIFGAVLLLAAIVLLGGRAYGQGGATGAIAGAVVDTSGASISGAEVLIISASTESVVRKLSTNSDGEFVATLLPPGTYDVVVNKSGFGEAKAQAIEVRITET